MRRNLTGQTDLQLRGLCRRLTVKQHKTTLWILFVPLTVACAYTAFRSFMGSRNRKSGIESTEEDSLHMESI